MTDKPRIAQADRAMLKDAETQIYRARALRRELEEKYNMADTKPIDITEGERLARGATQGEWRQDPRDGSECDVTTGGKYGHDTDIAEVCTYDRDAAYIAHHDPEYMLRLYGLVRELVKEVGMWSDDQECITATHGMRTDDGLLMCPACRARALLGQVNL